jgi:hypothetical protein
VNASQRVDDWLMAPIPRWRLARLQAIVVIFALGYLLVRIQIFWSLGRNTASAVQRFEPVGVWFWLDQPLRRDVWLALFVATVVAGIASLSRWLSRASTVSFAAGFLLVTTYRNSWGQLMWFENLTAVHLAVLAFVPINRATLVARCKRSRDTVTGWPMVICALSTVIAYCLAGVAKLRIGGLGWASGDVLAHHIAYSAARLQALGARSSPLASPIMNQRWLLHAGALLTLTLELSAPLILIIGRRRRRVAMAWCAVMWVFHVLIAATMFVVFPYHLAGLAALPVWWATRSEPETDELLRWPK